MPTNKLPRQIFRERLVVLYESYGGYLTPEAAAKVDNVLEYTKYGDVVDAIKRRGAGPAYTLMAGVRDCGGPRRRRKDY